MMNATKFLLEKIIANDKNGLSTLGHLNGKHLDDISKVMTQFAQETVMEVIDRLNKGERLQLGNGFEVYRPTRKKSKSK